MKVYDSFRWPDDVVLGAVVHFYGRNITKIPVFHSQYENMLSIFESETCKHQVSFSHIPSFNISDATGFISLHCKLFDC